MNVTQRKTNNRTIDYTTVHHSDFVCNDKLKTNATIRGSSSWPNALSINEGRIALHYSLKISPDLLISASHLETLGGFVVWKSLRSLQLLSPGRGVGAIRPFQINSLV